MVLLSDTNPTGFFGYAQNDGKKCDVSATLNVTVKPEGAVALRMTGRKRARPAQGFSAVFPF